MLITDAEIIWLKEYYPGLRFIKRNSGIIAGNLHFDMFYDEANAKYIINPDSDCHPPSMRIRDSYQIEITFQNSEQDLPIVKETGRRIETVAQANNLSMLDFHINNDGSACLCFIFDKYTYLPNGFNIRDFMHNLLVPFFYAQSFYERDHRWPWGEYEHGLFALFQWYAERKEAITIDGLNQCIDYIKRCKNIKGYKVPTLILTLLKQKDNIKGHQPCVCGSNIKFRNCHPRIFNGLWKMKKDYESINNNYQ
jgi:hypothetical protein